MVITLFQQATLGHQPQANRENAEKAFSLSPKSDILLLPETFTTAFGERLAEEAEETEGETLQWARRLAAEREAMVVGTWTVREGGRAFNRLHWVQPDGSFGHYDKAHLFRPSSEARELTAGSQRPVFHWRGWNIRPAVCYDLRFPTWLRNRRLPLSPTADSEPEAEAALEYDLLLFCASWPAGRREVWRTLLRARAIENECYVVGCNRSGQDDAGTQYTGDSALVDFKGNVLAEASGEQTLSFEIDLDALKKFRSRWPFYLDFD